MTVIIIVVVAAVTTLTCADTPPMSEYEYRMKKGRKAFSKFPFPFPFGLLAYLMGHDCAAQGSSHHLIFTLTDRQEE